MGGVCRGHDRVIVFAAIAPPLWLAVPAVLALAAAGRWPVLKVCGWGLLGLSWGVWHAERYLADRVSPADEGRPLTVEASMTGLPELSSFGRVRVRWQPLRRLDQGALPRHARLWELTGPPGDYRPGDVWQLTVTLKRPHGAASPGAFDLEAWLMSEGVSATGAFQAATRLRAGGGSVDGWRLDIRNRFLPLIADKPEAAVTLALLTGDRALVPDTLSALYRDTGIIHLMAISGPHVVLFALGAVWLVRRIMNLKPGVFRRVPFHRMAWPVLLLASLAYGLLAGWSLPTARTWVMLACCALAAMAGRRPDRWGVLIRALALVLFWQPLSVHAAGFWLSFAAVAVIQLWGGWRQQTALAQSTRLQWRLFVALMPLGLLFFGQVSLVSPVANLLAVPLIGLVVVPLGLIGLGAGMFWHHAGAACWYWAGCLLEGLGRVLGWLVAPGSPVWYWSPGPGSLVFFTLALLVWMAPRRLLPRELGVVLLLPALLPGVGVGSGELRLSVLDVGQGLSVLLETRHHRMLYDTGPSPRVGDSVVTPYLMRRGVRELDLLMLSHNDLDHTGGAQPVLDRLNVRHLSYSAPPEGYTVKPEVRQGFCRAGQRWDWDGVHFHVLSPLPSMAAFKDNDRSCVLRVSGEGYSVLLTGDIEEKAETALLAESALPQTDWLVVAHHGSKTSSSEAFLDRLRPRAGIISAGYRNRFGHPHPKVTARYENRAVPLAWTARTGTWVQHWRPGGDFVREEWRGRRHYWHNAP